jgi:uncharacterized repeat protein (TIGR01451 family)
MNERISKMKFLITISSALLFMLSVASVHAAADIRLKAAAEIEVPVVNDKGETELKRMPATKVIPGTEVIYTITVSNVGDQAADSAVVTDPIPENTTYVDRSAFGAGTKIAFSVDGGNSYDLADKLKVKDAAGNLRAATASDYTHIRWVLNFTLKPKDMAPVWFKARLD